MPNYSTIIRLASRIISHSTRSILPSRSCQFGISAGESSILEIRHGLVTLELRKDHGRGSILDRGLKIIEALKDCVFFSLSLVQQIKIRVFIFPFPFAEKWTPRRIFLVLNESYRLLWIFNFSSLDNLRNNRNGKIKNRDRWVKQVGR